MAAEEDKINNEPDIDEKQKARVCEKDFIAKQFLKPCIYDPEYNNRPLKTSYHTINDIAMFLATYRANITNVNVSVRNMANIMCQKSLGGSLVVLNTNFGSKALPGYEEYIKDEETKKIKDTKKAPKNGKPILIRKTQGTGVVFASAIEPCFEIQLKNGKTKIFKMNYFPTEEENTPNEEEEVQIGKKKKKIIKRKTTVESGDEVQVPGSLEPDFSDAKAVLQMLIEKLNQLKICDQPIKIIDSGPGMINLKCIVHEVFENGHKMLDVASMYESFRLDPRIINSVDPIDSGKLSFNFKTSDNHPKPPKVCIFHMSGKINIFGAKCYQHANEIFQFIEDKLIENEDFICEQLLSDAELAKLSKKKKTGEITKRKPVSKKEEPQIDYIKIITNYINSLTKKKICDVNFEITDYDDVIVEISRDREKAVKLLKTLLIPKGQSSLEDIKNTVIEICHDKSSKPYINIFAIPKSTIDQFHNKK